MCVSSKSIVIPKKTHTQQMELAYHCLQTRKSSIANSAITKMQRSSAYIVTYDSTQIEKILCDIPGESATNYYLQNGIYFMLSTSSQSYGCYYSIGCEENDVATKYNNCIMLIMSDKLVHGKGIDLRQIIVTQNNSNQRIPI